MAYRMFMTRGEYIMSEEYTFATAVETAAPMGVKVIGIKMDEQGLLPSSMDETLSTWDEKRRGAKRPWLLYTVPSGQNPTGATQGEKRRRDIYRCAQKYDVYILEDEPYFFLQMQPYTGPNAPDVPPPSTHEEFIKVLVPSLLSMDVDGRVMRLDSFSKVLAPGTRVGWVTASEQIIERFVRHNEVSIQNPSGISQLVLFKLLDETWGHAGYLDWLINLRLEYTKRRDVICNACEKHLPKEVASWNPPAAGMFVCTLFFFVLSTPSCTLLYHYHAPTNPTKQHWIKVDWRKHPNASFKPILDIEDEIYHAGINNGVLSCKGSWFRAEADPGEDMFFRTTFAAASSEEITEAIRRFGKGLRGVFSLD